MFNDRVKASAAKPVLRWKEGGTWRSATWAEWDKASREIAGGLLALGVGKGERSCVLANTRPEWLYCDIGILMAGGVTVPIYQSNLAARVRVHHQRLGREDRLRREPGAAGRS